MQYQDLDFVESDVMSVSPEKLLLGKDVLRSTTIEQLLAQNDDLMARLKVLARKLSQFEESQRSMAEENQRMKQEKELNQDKLLVYEEKDSYWKERLSGFEKQNQLLSEKVLALRSAYMEINKQNQRHLKYQSKIKNQVKPYIENLKSYNLELLTKLENLDFQIAKKTSECQDLRHQIMDVTQNFNFQLDLEKRQFEEMLKTFEESMTLLTEERNRFKEENEHLRLRVDKLHTLEERNVHLENELIETKRNAEVRNSKLESDLAQRLTQLDRLSEENVRLSVETADRERKILTDYTLIQNLESQNADLKHQLDTLRFMFNNKSEESDRSKEALRSLERINIELSQKIQELRTKNSDSSTKS